MAYTKNQIQSMDSRILFWGAREPCASNLVLQDARELVISKGKVQILRH